MLEVGDDTRSSFCLSLWSKHGSSSIVAGDVLLLQNIKIVEFRNGVEGRASQISAVQVLLNSKDLTQPTGDVEELERRKRKGIDRVLVHLRTTISEQIM